MKKLAVYHLFIFGVLLVFIVSTFAEYSSYPDILAILGLDIMLFESYQLSYLNPLHLLTFVLLILTHLIYCVEKLNRSAGLFGMILYRIGRKQYYFKRLKMIIGSVFQSLSFLYLTTILFRLLLKQSILSVFFLDFLFLLKLGMYLSLLLLIYEFGSFQLKSTQLLLGQVVFTVFLLVISLSLNIQLLNYIGNLSLALQFLPIIGMVFVVVFIILYVYIRKGDLL